MDEVVSIAPVAGEPGLTAYECPNFGYVMSVLEHPKRRVNSSRAMSLGSWRAGHSRRKRENFIRFHCRT
jgi:hypothetical protein